MGSLAFIPGRRGSIVRPLDRFLPPLPARVVRTSLQQRIPAGSWVLDPFGSAPMLAVEAAQAGYRVLVAVNNPVVRFLLEMTTTPPSADELRVALADLAATRKGGERLEPHIRALYTTPCAQCGREIEADAFLWERKAPAPYARIYRCRHCGSEGEYPATEFDETKTAQFTKHGLHRSWALERVAPLKDPDRAHAEEALEVYLPRAVYVIFNLINKMESLPHPRNRRRHLAGLLISAFDRANTLWPYPVARDRPRQLTVPPHHLEYNVWQTLDNAVSDWSRAEAAVPLSTWPEPPPAGGGVVLFEGRMKDLAPSLPQIEIAAVITALPRPNQAFWTLCAVWSAWLWGREALGPFKAVLRRRRYDWAWHGTALHAGFKRLIPYLRQGTPVITLIPEAEPGFLSAAYNALHTNGLIFEGIALQAESGRAQLVWRTGTRESVRPPQASPEEVAAKAARAILAERGEPSAFLHIQAAALGALANSHVLDDLGETPAEIHNRLNDLYPRAFSQRQGFQRYGASPHSLEVGQWWHPAGKGSDAPLADRVEMALVRYLQSTPVVMLSELETHLFERFRGLHTPEESLIETCVESYLAQEKTAGHWQLRAEETPEARAADLADIRQLLTEIGERLDYHCEMGTPLIWSEQERRRYVFYLTESAIIGEILLGNPYLPSQSFVVLPGGRANLVLYKLRKDPRLKEAADAGWRFLKFRHVRRLAETPLLNRDNLDDQFALDPLTYTKHQIPLL